MNRKRLTTYFLVMVLILGMSPVLNVSARAGSDWYTFVAYENRPQITVNVTCHARLNGRNMMGSFSYSYPQTPYIAPSEYIREIELFARDSRGNYSIENRTQTDCFSYSLTFDPNVTTSYSFYFDRVYRKTLFL